MSFGVDHKGLSSCFLSAGWVESSTSGLKGPIRFSAVFLRVDKGHVTRVDRGPSFERDHVAANRV